MSTPTTTSRTQHTPQWTRQKLYQYINDELSAGCGTTLSLTSKQLDRLIDDVLDWFYHTYEHSVQTSYLILPAALFETAEWRCNREVFLPPTVEAIYNCWTDSTRGPGYIGDANGDFAVSRLLATEVYLSTAIGEGLLNYVAYRAMYNLSQSLVTNLVNFEYNAHTHRLFISGRNPGSNLILQTAERVPAEALFSFPLFRRYVVGRSLMQLGRIIGLVNYPLAGSVELNFSMLRDDGQQMIEKVEEDLRSAQTPDFMYMYR